MFGLASATEGTTASPVLPYYRHRAHQRHVVEPDGLLDRRTVNERGHVPVLLEPLLALLEPRAGQCVVDCTLGLAGHARALAERVGDRGRLIGIDLDADNLDRADERLTGVPCPYELVRGNFADLDEILRERGVERADRILADLGLSSSQLDDPGRGFSFLQDGELDMRIDRDQELTGIELVNRLGERELADLIYHNSQERFSRRIAKRICKVRRQGRIRSTRVLAETVASAMNVDPASRKSKIHPATRTFQAIRMAVNGEMNNLQMLLSIAPKCLAEAGRIGVISFHSVEDREVKVDFKHRTQQGLYTILTKRPVIAGPEERQANPRSRSAKLRVAERTDRPWAPALDLG